MTEHSAPRAYNSTRTHSPDAIEGEAVGQTRLRLRLAWLAFAADRGIAAVEVSLDDGATWQAASLEEALSAFTWVRWAFDYTAVPDRHRLVVRAIDGDGVPQIMTRRDPLPEGATGYHIRPVRVDREA